MLAAGAALAAAVAGCNAASHLHVLQPPSPSGHPPPAGVAAPVRVPAPDPQLGIDIDFYGWKGIDVAALAAADVAYVRRLHANAVSISFPFFMSGPAAADVYATSATPSPAGLATLAADAESAGLYVSIRPLLDEHSLGTSRVHWKPADPAAWFASYQRFLVPYAEMARAMRIPALVTGTEFSEFSASPYWPRLDAALRRIYHGRLWYANNWGGKLPAAVDAAGVTQTIDAYHPLPLPPGASLAQVEAAWDAYGRTLPRRVILTEVGIAAQAGAYAAPYRWGWHHRPLAPAIQERWFTAACRAVAADHLGGVYFWPLGFGQKPGARPTVSYPTAFAYGPGASAIGACFRRLGREG